MGRPERPRAYGGGLFDPVPLLATCRSAGRHKGVIHLDLFSGIGGFALATQLAGVPIDDRYYDVDPHGNRVYGKQFLAPNSKWQLLVDHHDGPRRCRPTKLLPSVLVRHAADFIESMATTLCDGKRDRGQPSWNREGWL